jgi:hypothetical protein
MIKICVNCGKEFECYDKIQRGLRKQKSKAKYKRPINSINCSHKCSREYEWKRIMNKRKKKVNKCQKKRV